MNLAHEPIGAGSVGTFASHKEIIIFGTPSSPGPSYLGFSFFFCPKGN